MAAFIESVIVVGVEDDPAVDVAGGPAEGLDERGGRAQEAFLVRVQDGYQGDLGQVQALAQQVDADQGVEVPAPQLAQDLDPLQRLDVRMQVADAQALLVEVAGQVLGHLLGQGGDQGPLARCRPGLDLPPQVLDLAP